MTQGESWSPESPTVGCRVGTWSYLESLQPLGRRRELETELNQVAHDAIIHVLVMKPKETQATAAHLGFLGGEHMGVLGLEGRVMSPSSAGRGRGSCVLRTLSSFTLCISLVGWS